MRARLGFVLGAVLVLGCSCRRIAPAPSKPAIHAASAPPVQYARGLVLPADASDLLKRSAADAAGTLHRMTGADFTVGSSPAARGILLVRAGAKEALARDATRLKDQGPEAFVLRGDGPERLWIVANTDLGLVAGLYDYLRSLGCRWLLPGENWTIVPHRGDIGRVVDKLDKPAFAGRTFGGTGGFGKSPSDPKRALPQLWDDWKRRNAFGGSYFFGGHTGEAFNLAHRAVLEAHPEYLALVNGKRSPWSVGAKLCVSNPDAVKLYVEDRVASLRRKPEFAVSVEPGDGEGFCECARCRAIGSGSVSDQVFYLANQVARAVAKEIPGGNVSLYAYSGHAALPSLPIEPNVYVVAITDAWQRTGMAPDDLLRAWAKRKTSLGIYTYWNLPDGYNDLPQFDWLNTPAERIRFWHSLGLTNASFETTFASGPMGLALYLSSRLLWDPKTDEKALADEFFRLAFERAAPPMRRMLERFTNGFLPNSLELAYRDLAEARTLAGDGVEVGRRIKDFEGFIQYLRLWQEYQGAPAGSAERREKARAVVKWLYRIELTTMVATQRMQQLIIDRYERDSILRAEFNQANWAAPGWQGLAQPNDTEMRALMADGRAKLRPIDIPERRYSNKLVPLPPAIRPPALPPSPMRLIGPTDIEFQVSSDCASLEFDVLVTAGAKVPGDAVTVRAPDGSVLHSELVPPDGVQHRISVTTRGGGRYLVHVEDQKALFTFSPPAGIPMAFRQLVSPMPSPSMYFFVPKGLRRLAMYTPNGSPFQLFDGDGHAVATGAFSWLVQVDVPSGQDGRVWSLKNLKAWQSVRMMNAPQSFALSPDTVLVPEDVIR